MNRFIVLSCCLCLCVSLFAVPSFATETESASTVEREVIDYRDFISDHDIVGDNSNVTISLPDDYCSVYTKTSSGVVQFPNRSSGTVSFANKVDAYASLKFCMPGLMYSEPRYYMSLDNIPDETPLHLYTKFSVNPNFEGTYNLRVFYQINYYDQNYKNIAVLPSVPKSVTFSNLSGYYVGSFATVDDPENVIAIPDNAKYFAISLVARVEDIQTESEVLSIDFDFSDWSLDLTFPKDYNGQFDFYGDVGTFFTSSVGWLGDISSFVISHPILIICFAIPVVVIVVAVCKRFIFV